jgi:hypothetical protein
VIGLRRETFDLRMQDRFPELARLQDRALGILGDEHERTKTIWTTRDSLDAKREGWDVFDCGDSENGRWQTCRVDDPLAWRGTLGFTPGRLKSDEAAWKVVMQGDAPHHINAREFVRLNNPAEYALMAKHAGRISANENAAKHVPVSPVIDA